MRIGYLEKYIAVFCVLFYAALYAGHNNSVLANSLAEDSIFQNGALCSVYGVEIDQGDPSTPEKNSQCPICMGAAPVAFVLCELPSFGDAPIIANCEPVIVVDAFISPTTVTLPPSRAPPVAV